MEHFADRLIKKIKKTSPICVGLDPRYNLIPEKIKTESPTIGTAIFEFNKGIIDAVADLVPIVKPQVAFYEMFGLDGMAAFSRTIHYAQEKGLLVLADVKRNDIGSTAEAYANTYLDESGDFVVDALTVTPYLGYDGIKPFIEMAQKNNKGIFILVKTSNPSSGDFQDRVLDQEQRPLYELVGDLVESWGADELGDSGYSSVGAVVGATYPEQAIVLRKIMPNSLFLVPGYGAQGGTASDVKACFNDDGLGAIINSSRGICYAYQKSDTYDADAYADAARESVVSMKVDIEQALLS